MVEEFVAGFVGLTSSFVPVKHYRRNYQVHKACAGWFSGTLAATADRLLPSSFRLKLLLESSLQLNDRLVLDDESSN